MNRKSNLPAAGGNLFQKIKLKCTEAEQAGRELLRLSIGQPEGPALQYARITASTAVQSHGESMHEYQDNGSPGVPDFAKRFVKVHVKKPINSDQVDYLPIPGIKPMLGVVIDAMGGWCEDAPTVAVGTMTNPGYPTPVDQCRMKKGVSHFHLPLNPANKFLFTTKDVAEKTTGFERKLLMLNFPHNPTGIVAREKYLRELCSYCSDNDIHIFGDSAYAILAYSKDATTLADVAVDFPNLNWCEAFSASKAGNFTGWRVGAMIGSREFMGDIKQIKGNTDSGFAAPLAAGIISLFENSQQDIEQVKELYRRRLIHLNKILKDAGMRLAVEPEAGFFSFFDCPKQAFGQEITSAEEFNNLMIEKTGIVGVHFDPYVRYAVCARDIFSYEDQISDAFQSAKVSY